MAYSHISYAGDGVTQDYIIPFGYIKIEDVHISIDDAEQTYFTDYAYLSSGTIRFTSPPPLDSTVRIQRLTDKEILSVDFRDGSTLTERDLDLAFLQLLYICQEAYDALDGETAVAAKDRAEEILQNARLFNTTREAVAGLQAVYATTARPRNQIKTVHTAEHADGEIDRLIKAENMNVGILFGPERTGLHNDDVSIADAVIEIPLNPRHCSLNLSQAVLLVGYEWHKRQINAEDVRFVTNTTVPASREMVMSFLDCLEKELAGHPGFKDEEKRPHMEINLRNIFTRGRLTEQEINTLFGIVKYLSRR